MKNKTNYTVGQELELTLLKGKFGNRPIARTDSGIICLLDQNAKGFYEYGSTWKCKITEVCEKKLVYMPVKMIYDKEFNDNVVACMMLDLSLKFNKKTKKSW